MGAGFDRAMVGVALWEYSNIKVLRALRKAVERKWRHNAACCRTTAVNERRGRTLAGEPGNPSVRLSNDETQGQSKRPSAKIDARGALFGAFRP